MSNKKFDEKTFNVDHAYPLGAWSRHLDKSLPDLFKNSFDLENYKKMIDLSDVSQINILKKEEEKKLEINKNYMKQFKEMKKSHEVNGWSYVKTEKVRQWQQELCFNWLINYNFMYYLKRRESSWSWYLIVISTLCSTLTLLDIANFNILNFIKYVVTFFSIITSLIAAYMKKENYVERIKEMDRYIQKVGVIHMEIQGILQAKPWNRMEYEQFSEKYYNEIVQLFSTTPPMSPEEFKVTIYNLTVHNPELIFEQSPWYELKKIGDLEYYHMTAYGKEVILSHRANLYRINRVRWIISGLYKCFFYSNCSRCCSYYQNYHSYNFLNYIQYNNRIIQELVYEKVTDNKFKKKIIEENIKFDNFWKEKVDNKESSDKDESSKNEDKSEFFYNDDDDDFDINADNYIV